MSRYVALLRGINVGGKNLVGMPALKAFCEAQGLADVAADVARIRAIWRECRRAASGGEFLFGPFTIADAMFAPVVTRFASYGVKLDGPEAEYAGAVWRHPAVQKWVEAARAEPFAIPRYDGPAA